MTVTIDVDAKYVYRNKRQVAANLALKSYYALKKDEPNRNIVIEISASGKGFHLIREGDDGTIRNELKLRERFGDDPIRIKIEKYKLSIGSHNLNVLWTEKYGKRVHKITVSKLRKIAVGRPN